MNVELDKVYYSYYRQLVLTTTRKLGFDLYVIIIKDETTGETISRTFNDRTIAITEFNKYFK